MPPLREATTTVRARFSYAAHVGLGQASLSLGLAVPGFVILAQGRTGSTLLADLLNSHPAIRCEGELLARHPRYGEPLIAGKAARFALSRRTWGFKAKHYQIAGSFPEGGREFLSRLQKNGWRIVWLRRINLVRTALSTLVGLQRNTWAYDRGDTRERPALRLDPDDFVRHLRGRVTQGEVERSFLEGLSYHEVLYERDLANIGREAELKELLAYLGTSPHPLQTTLRPTEERPVSDYIENWNELRELAAREGFGDMAAAVETRA